VIVLEAVREVVTGATGTHAATEPTERIPTSRLELTRDIIFLRSVST
jgi:hypothetical protein